MEMSISSRSNTSEEDDMHIMTAVSSGEDEGRNIN
jgi:hypothetical protein